MASIFTGLAFMHGHIVDRELVLRLGRDESTAVRAATAPQAAPARHSKDRKVPQQACAGRACVSC
jgi:hypothetical protein